MLPIFYFAFAISTNTACIKKAAASRTTPLNNNIDIFIFISKAPYGRNVRGAGYYYRLVTSFGLSVNSGKYNFLSANCVC